MKLGILSAIAALLGGAGSTVLDRTGPRLPTKENQRTAAKSQRVMRVQRGMRPRYAVHARDVERRAKHAIKGSKK